MLADQYDVVIGADTHRDTNALAAVRSFNGALIASTTISTDDNGYRAAILFADTHAAGSRAWALEGTGSYGAGLARFLSARGERVIEIDRPARSDGPSHAKSDELDAARAARTALGRTSHPTPRIDPVHDALRALHSTRAGAVSARTAAINELRALAVCAPDRIRQRLRDTTIVTLVSSARTLRHRRNEPIDEHATITAIRLLASRIDQLTRESTLLERDLATLVRDSAPQLLAEPGIGVITAAQILISWSHPGRVRSEAAFARLAGAAPIPASSGQTSRHRLDRGGDRQLNRTLHTIVLSRLQHDERTTAYAERARRRGKTRRETIRILKRYLARHLYRLLEHPTTTTPTGITIGPCS